MLLGQWRILKRFFDSCNEEDESKDRVGNECEFSSGRLDGDSKLIVSLLLPDEHFEAVAIDEHITYFETSLLFGVKYAIISDCEVP
jgi:hypothetical protein